MFVTHALMRALIKYLTNDWYARFYDAVGSVSGIVAVYDVVVAEAADGASGEGASVTHSDSSALAAHKHAFNWLLLEFALLSAPSVFLHPLFRYVINRWCLAWRLALVHHYLMLWRADVSQLDNGAQRVHEDTKRFTRGVQTCVSTVLESVMTLLVFAPVLLKVGATLYPHELFAGWLLLLCACVAVVGLFGSLLLGWPLVALDIRNQIVEAQLRKELVLLETTAEHAPARRMHTTHAASSDAPENATMLVADLLPGPCVSDSKPRPDDDAAAFYPHTQGSDELECDARSRARPRTSTRQRVLQSTRALRHNYLRLYYRLGTFSLWLNLYEQAVVFIPYCLAAPLLYHSNAERRISLGALMQLSNSFASVFASLNILTDNWTEVSDFVAVLTRLREWEAHLLVSQTGDARARLMCSSGDRSDGSATTGTTTIAMTTVASPSHVEMQTHPAAPQHI